MIPVNMYQKERREYTKLLNVCQVNSAKPFNRLMQSIGIIRLRERPTAIHDPLKAKRKPLGFLFALSNEGDQIPIDQLILKLTPARIAIPHGFASPAVLSTSFSPRL